MDHEKIASVIALSRLKGVDAPLMSLLNERGVEASDFLAMTPAGRGEALGLIQSPSAWTQAEIRDAFETGKREAEFCSRHHIRVLSPLLDNYPRRLSILDDTPSVLFVLGKVDPDALRILSIVGTRRLTPSGERYCRKLVEDLAELKTGALIVSGLAYGTDACAHSAALDNGLPTAGVLAHGLAMIYPAAHRALAERILGSGGGLVTHYLSGDKPFRGRFLERNRVIAALSDGVMVVESAVKGGAMNTARAALQYDRSVMAMPGRPSDPMSEGCNLLIRRGAAILSTDAREVCETLQWTLAPQSPPEDVLFREPDASLMPVYSILLDSPDPVGIDLIMVKTGLRAAQVSAMLFTLEEEGFALRLPNNRFTTV